jgi:hypothetical protein
VRFSIQNAPPILQATLVYRSKDQAFDVEPKLPGGGASLLVNDVQLELDEDGRVLYVWGLCSQALWDEQAVEPPQARTATLFAERPEDLSPGMSVRLNKEPWPVAADRRSGWIRIGESSATDEAVEFAPGMIAALLDGHLVGLWLRPRI